MSKHCLGNTKSLKQVEYLRINVEDTKSMNEVKCHGNNMEHLKVIKINVKSQK